MRNTTQSYRTRNDLEKCWNRTVLNVECAFDDNQHVLRTDFDNFPFHERFSKCREELNALAKKKQNLQEICAKLVEYLEYLCGEIRGKFPEDEQGNKELKNEYRRISLRHSQSIATLESQQLHYTYFLKRIKLDAYWKTTEARIEVFMADNNYEMRTDLEGLSPTERAEICNAELAILEKKKDKLEKYTKIDIEFLEKLIEESIVECPEDDARYVEINYSCDSISQRYKNLIALLSSYEEKYRGYLAADKDSS